MRKRSRPASKSFLRALQASRQSSGGRSDEAKAGDSRELSGRASPATADHDPEHHLAAGETRVGSERTSPSESGRGPGRPLILGPRPWQLAGMSKRTWYRKGGRIK